VSMIGFEAADRLSGMKIHLDSAPGKSWVRIREGAEGSTLPLSDQNAELMTDLLMQVHAAILPMITAAAPDREQLLQQAADIKSRFERGEPAL